MYFAFSRRDQIPFRVTFIDLESWKTAARFLFKRRALVPDNPGNPFHCLYAVKTLQCRTDELAELPPAGLWRCIDETADVLDYPKCVCEFALNDQNTVNGSRLEGNLYSLAFPVSDRAEQKPGDC